nr:hypothetical protein [Tanacetum cinerariifolium]
MSIAWKTSKIREAPSCSSKQKTVTQSEQLVDDVPILDGAHILGTEDTSTAHLLKIKTRLDWLKPIPEEERPETPELDWAKTGDMGSFSNGIASRLGSQSSTKLILKIDLANPKGHRVVPDPEHAALYEALETSIDHSNREEFVEATAKSHKRRRDDQDPPPPPPKDSDQNKKKKHDSDANDIANAYKDPEENKLIQKTGDMRSFSNGIASRLGSQSSTKLILKIDLANPKGHRVVPDVSKPLPLGGPLERRNAPSIYKLKAAYHPDSGLEKLVPSLWIESEHEYDISAAYGISHWWFKRKNFYITRHSAASDRRAVRCHMWILSVVSLKTFSRYSYTYLKEIVLRRADYKEYKILEADFKNLHPNDFKDLYLLHLQGNHNHLSGADKVHLFNAVNLWFRNIVIRKHYTIVYKPMAIIYRDRNNQKKMMRESEVYNFSDGTLIRILEQLDHMAKDFVLFKFNPGMEHRIWSEDDKKRSKEFIEVIERRLKIKRIFKSLESFVSGRFRDVDYRLIQRTE